MRPFGGGPAPRFDDAAACRRARAGRSGSQSVGPAALPAPRSCPACGAGTATCSPSASCPAGRPLVLFTRPEHAKEIFAGDPEVFHAGKGNAILGPIMGEHSLLLQDGSEHKRARALLMPAFNGHALRGYRGLVERGRPRGGRRAGSRGDEFRSLDRMNALTLEVILRVVFGVTDESRLAELRPCVNRTVNISPAVLLGWGYPALQRFGPWKRTVANAYRLDELIYAEIRERRTAPDLDRAHRRALAADPGRRRRRPAHRRRAARPAGHAAARRATRPPRPRWPGRSRARPRPRSARAGRARPRDTGDDDYLEAVLKESMRLHPVIPMVVRTLMQPATVGGWDLPAGATVGPVDPDRAQPRRQPSRPRAVRPRPVPRPEPAGQHLDPVRRRRPALHRGRVLADGGRRRAAADPHGVRRDRRSAPDRPKVRNITSVPRRGSRIRVG